MIIDYLAIALAPSLVFGYSRSQVSCAKKSIARLLGAAGVNNYPGTWLADAVAQAYRLLVAATFCRRKVSLGYKTFAVI